MKQIIRSFGQIVVGVSAVSTGQQSFILFTLESKAEASCCTRTIPCSRQISRASRS